MNPSLSLSFDHLFIFLQLLIVGCRLLSFFFFLGAGLWMELRVLCLFILLALSSQQQRLQPMKCEHSEYSLFKKNVQQGFFLRAIHVVKGMCHHSHSYWWLRGFRCIFIIIIIFLFVTWCNRRHVCRRLAGVHPLRFEVRPVPSLLVFWEAVCVCGTCWNWLSPSMF